VDHGNHGTTTQTRGNTMQKTEAGADERDAPAVNLSHLTLLQRCDYTDCCKPLQTLLQCAKCKSASYCSKDCQTKAWKAGHKRECAPGRGASIASLRRRALQQAEGAQRGLTAEQRRLLMKMANLHAVEDWRGLVALEREARAVADAVRGSEPRRAGFVFVTLGIAYHNVGDISKAIDCHTEDLKIAQEVGGRKTEGVAIGNLGAAYDELGEFENCVSVDGGTS
jgi:hypothetical protein